ncbi:hypothetical protein A8F94_22410 [Bacillus sp. FJAT-27225]|uniref:hypothetical protein n=1 Tax=Bacillus sp. FJAT-27225 TaxID=1743144 RepID=UPI00080C316D|nr:hypothetical protein [Bacillus sp. FJAT-27225]OCA81622.1 hypothetical protein A8F94_22410 [Bacillus sp. FJAT-27225]
MKKRHFLFNLAIIIFPWLSVLLLGKRSFKRFWFSGLFIVVFEIINHLYGHRRNWWKFYDGYKSFFKDEFPFSIGPYMPLSMWILKFSYGNFRRFVLLNAVADGLFAFVLINVLKKLKIIGLNGLTHLQFFVYLNYKAYLLYGVQYLYEKMTGHSSQSYQ